MSSSSVLADLEDGTVVCRFPGFQSLPRASGPSSYTTAWDSKLGNEPTAWKRLAPEALLSRLSSAGIDVDQELRNMLGGGSPNAIHAVAVEVLRQGGSVWTTNFDELIEASAVDSKVEFHCLLPDDDPCCDCQLGHLLKVHGTLSARRVMARSEQVMLPLQPAWLRRLATDCSGAEVGIIGYAGADVDLRSALSEALCTTRSTWFGTEADREPLTRRFSQPLSQKRLSLQLSERPDLTALDWARDRDLASSVAERLLRLAREPIRLTTLSARYVPNNLIRARILDDFGKGVEARDLYAAALVHGPRRLRAARALYTSGLIHGAPWRPFAVAILDGACAVPVSWRWPHLTRLPYLTWNVPPNERLLLLERSLRMTKGDTHIRLATANAAKEVNPRRAVELGRQAQQEALARRHPADAAWATFTLSLAYRWLGDLGNASEVASQLADGFDTLAGPVWVAWGYFELGAIAALSGDLSVARKQMALGTEVFEAAGSMFAFDARCGLLTIARAAGDQAEQKAAHKEARRLLTDDALRQRFKREVLMAEEAELARGAGRLEEARAAYEELATSSTVGQELLGLLGLGEVQRMAGASPEAAWRALARSEEVGFGYGQVHAAVTLGLSGAMDAEEAERRIALSNFKPPVRDDRTGLLRFCLGPAPEVHALFFP